MNAVRRLALATMAAAAFVLAGCATHDAPAQRYTESISSVLVSEDGQRIAAIGSSHHDIFGAPEVLVKALRSPVHPRLTATFSPFHIDRGGDVTGDWLLTLAPTASASERDAAKAVGLAPGADGALTASGRLEGRRHTGWTTKLRGPQDRLNQADVIDITTEYSATDVALDNAATPIRVAADGVQLIYRAPLAPVIAPILFLARAKDH